jgi:hypothetical protein
MYYSFFATCKKNNINPQKWLVGWIPISRVERKRIFV